MRSLNQGSCFTFGINPFFPSPCAHRCPFSFFCFKLAGAVFLDRFVIPFSRAIIFFSPKGLLPAKCGARGSGSGRTLTSICGRSPKWMPAGTGRRFAEVNGCVAKLWQTFFGFTQDDTARFGLFGSFCWCVLGACVVYFFHLSHSKLSPNTSSFCLFGSFAGCVLCVCVLCILFRFFCLGDCLADGFPRCFLAPVEFSCGNEEMPPQNRGVCGFLFGSGRQRKRSVGLVSEDPGVKGPKRAGGGGGGVDVQVCLKRACHLVHLPLGFSRFEIGNRN